MRSHHRSASRLFTALVLLTGLLLAMPANPVAAQEPLDVAIDGGRFYKQANGAGGAGTTGFSVVDGAVDANAPAIPMFTAYHNLGGPARWGFPISYRFRFALGDPFVYQAFQNGLLQWDPGTQAVRPANLMDLLSQAGYDPRLLQDGYPVRQDDASAGNFAAAQAERLGWLDTAGFADLRAAYLANGGAGLLGLPAARPAAIGNLRVLRTQRTALVSVDNGPVQIRNAGDQAKFVGFLTGDPIVAKGSDANTALTATIMTAGSAAAAQPAPVSVPATQFAFQYRVVYTRTGTRCDRTLLHGDVRDAFGVPRNAVYFRTFNDQGNEVFFLSGLDQPIEGIWTRDMGEGVRPGTWSIEIVSEPGGRKLSDTAIVRFDGACTQGSVNEIFVFFQENPAGSFRP